MALGAGLLGDLENQILATAKHGSDVIQGSPTVIERCARSFATIGDGLAEAAKGFSHLTEDQWTGTAADAFREKFDPQPKKLAMAAENLLLASNAMNAYADELAAAQKSGLEAARAYQRGAKLTESARKEYEDAKTRLEAHQLIHHAIGIPIVVHMPDFVDPGATLKAQAVKDAATARNNAGVAAGVCARAVSAATTDAPAAPHHSFLDSVTSAVTGGVEGAWGDVKSGAEWSYNNVVVPTVNEASNLGQAMLDDPNDFATTVGGLLTMAGGATLFGVGLATTEVGVGIPVAALGISVVGTGAVLTEKGAQGLGQQYQQENNNVMHAVSKAQRQVDPGYGGSPVRSSTAPAPPSDAAPYDPAIAHEVEPWGGRDSKTRGILENDGHTTGLQSGKSGPAQDMPGGKGSGMNGNLKTHVEAHAGASLGPGDSATLYINRLPCGPSGSVGCSSMLPRYLPPGAKLTVYGPNNYVQVFYGSS